MRAGEDGEDAFDVALLLDAIANDVEGVDVATAAGELNEGVGFAQGANFGGEGWGAAVEAAARGFALEGVLELEVKGTGVGIAGAGGGGFEADGDLAGFEGEGHLFAVEGVVEVAFGCGGGGGGSLDGFGLEGLEAGEGGGEGDEAGEAKAGEWTTHRVKPLVDGGVFHAEGLSFCGVGRYAILLCEFSGNGFQGGY